MKKIQFYALSPVQLKLNRPFSALAPISPLALMECYLFVQELVVIDLSWTYWIKEINPAFIALIPKSDKAAQ